MTDSIRPRSTPSLENLPPLPPSDSSSGENHGAEEIIIIRREVPLPPFKRVAVVDFDLNTNKKVVSATRVSEMPRFLRENRVRIYFTHGIDTLNTLKLPRFVMARLLPRIEEEHRR
jgi:hypothetical protein